MLRYEAETTLWRFALPRRGWWRRAKRYRRPTRPLSQRHINRHETLKRQAWLTPRTWRRSTRGVLLPVVGAVPYGPARVRYKIVPHFDANDVRQYIHQVMAVFGNTEKEVVLVADRSGLHRAKQLAATIDHDDGKFPRPLLPAHCGHQLNPIAGFWRAMKDTSGAGRCFADLHLLYQRTRQVLMAHHERPIFEFHW